MVFALCVFCGNTLFGHAATPPVSSDPHLTAHQYSHRFSSDLSAFSGARWRNLYCAAADPYPSSKERNLHCTTTLTASRDSHCPAHHYNSGPSVSNAARPRDLYCTATGPRPLPKHRDCHCIVDPSVPSWSHPHPARPRCKPPSRPKPPKPVQSTSMSTARTSTWTHENWTSSIHSHFPQEPTTVQVFNNSSQALNRCWRTFSHALTTLPLVF